MNTGSRQNGKREKKARKRGTLSGFRASHVTQRHSFSILRRRPMVKLAFWGIAFLCVGTFSNVSGQDPIESRLESEELAPLVKLIRTAALEYMFYVDVLSKETINGFVPENLARGGWTVSGKPSIFVFVSHGQDDGFLPETEKRIVQAKGR